MKLGFNNFFSQCLIFSPLSSVSFSKPRVFFFKKTKQFLFLKLRTLHEFGKFFPLSFSRQVLNFLHFSFFLFLRNEGQITKQ